MTVTLFLIVYVYRMDDESMISMAFTASPGSVNIIGNSAMVDQVDGLLKEIMEYLKCSNKEKETGDKITISKQIGEYNTSDCMAALCALPVSEAELGRTLLELIERMCLNSKFLWRIISTPETLEYLTTNIMVDLSGELEMLEEQMGAAPVIPDTAALKESVAFEIEELLAVHRTSYLRSLGVEGAIPHHRLINMKGEELLGFEASVYYHMVKL